MGIPDDQLQLDSRRSLGWLGLFASATTLVCCALPILLVTLGFGATVAAMFEAVPVLVFFGEHKAWTFLIAGVLLATAGLAYRRQTSCPADPELARACEQARRWNQRVLVIASVLWVTGFAAAYLALPVARWLDSIR